MPRLPTLFISHGAPTFAVEPGRAGALLHQLGLTLPRPAAIVVVSPHWMTRGPLRVTTSPSPATLHDFGGFPPRLYELRYAAPGDPVLAARVIATLRAEGWPAEADGERGLDHGAWVPLLHLFPAADIPVIQVSLPASLDEAAAVRLGQVLGALAAQGVLVIGSGSLTHNLYDLRLGADEAEPYALAFTAWVRRAVLTGDLAALTRALAEAPHGRRAHPTPEHFLPLLVAAGAAAPGSAVEVLDGGIEHGVLSMESYVFRPATASATDIPQ